MENRIVRTVCGIMHKPKIESIVYKQIGVLKQVVLKQVDKLTK
jgi:hypothetical protein